MSATESSATSATDEARRFRPLSRPIRPPFGDLVIVERLPPRTRTDGGIEIPEVARDKSIVARVIAVGSGKRQMHTDWDLPTKPIVEPGALVIVAKWEGAEFTVDGRDLLLMQEGGILAEVTEL